MKRTGSIADDLTAQVASKYIASTVKGAQGNRKVPSAAQLKILRGKGDPTYQAETGLVLSGRKTLGTNGKQIRRTTHGPAIKG